MQKISKLLWDEWNTNHISKHDLSVKEVEISFNDKKMMIKSTYNSRYLVLARSQKRLLSIILAYEGNQSYYIVTTRDMSKKERKVYRNE